MLLNSAFISLFLSTPSARRATHQPVATGVSGAISIHALREEGDGTRRPMVPKPSNFYPRPPRGGRPKATEAAEAKEYFYPRPPRGGRRTTPRYSNITKNFYPRPPRGGRPFSFSKSPVFSSFLSTPSARRATLHALRLLALPKNFYPRPPRGGRPSPADAKGAGKIFLSTPSARRATPQVTAPAGGWAISIHALREEGDLYPVEGDGLVGISIHALREEGDELLLWLS